ncbi:hypothetical protein GCM10018793_50640 [Streptomyces sulfonofaciens]|uniref:Transposase n=1 Tax=Streptomyces sulfonofaciens TaxID=68272 RepID=A0A919GJ00_9ACTN|nr:hypothetical protein GCM10018793_50640 [Streptomyces sulfonofaciens]
MLLHLAYLTVTNAFAALRLLPKSDRDKDAEILALRHQLMVLERQLGADRVTFASEGRAFLAALLLRCRARFHVGCVCWFSPTPCCGGTGICSSVAMPVHADRRDQVARPPFARSAI